MNAGPAQPWLDRAKEDLVVAKLVLKEGHASHSCFLKAFLLAKTKTHPRAHKLLDLVAECEKLQHEFHRFRNECMIVDQYYIPTRYPNGIPGNPAAGLPGNREAAEAIHAADQIFDFVAGQVQ